MRGATAKQSAEPRRVERISPHQRIRVGNVHDHAAPRANGVGDHRRERPGATAQRTVTPPNAKPPPYTARP